MGNEACGGCGGPDDGKMTDVAGVRCCLRCQREMVIGFVEPDAEPPERRERAEKKHKSLASTERRGKWERHFDKRLREALKVLKWEARYDAQEKRKQERDQRRERDERLKVAARLAAKSRRKERKEERRKEKRRERKWAGVPEDRVCPRCGDQVVKRRAWVVLEGWVGCLRCRRAEAARVVNEGKETKDV